MINTRDLVNLVRDPFFNWNEAYTQSMVPEEGTTKLSMKEMKMVTSLNGSIGKLNLKK